MCSYRLSIPQTQTELAVDGGNVHGAQFLISLKDSKPALQLLEIVFIDDYFF